MLSNAMRTLMKREKRILLMGTGVPMTATWESVSVNSSTSDKLMYLSEPRGERQSVVSTEGPGLTRSGGKRVQTRADTQY